jgi:hypothetical protein
MSDELNEMVGDLLNQLNDAQSKAKEMEKEKNPLKKEELEKFVIEKGGTLVEDTLEMVKNVRDYILSAPEAKDVDAFASLISAAANAIETLNKIAINDKKTDTIIQVKKMDIDARKEMNQENNETKMLATREQIFKLLADGAKTIDAEVVETKQIDH